MTRRGFFSVVFGSLSALVAAKLGGSAKGSSLTVPHGGPCIETVHLGADALAEMGGPSMVQETDGAMWTDGKPRFVVTNRMGVFLVEKRESYRAQYPPRRCCSE